MKKKIYKICGVALALVLVFSLFGAFLPVKQVEAQAYTPNQWNTMTIPTGLGQVLRAANVADFAVGPDGNTIYAIDNQTTDAILRSTNGGQSFTVLVDPVGFTGPATLVAVSPDDPLAVAVVDSTLADRVFYSNNGGATWSDLGDLTGAGAVANEDIYDIAISPARAAAILGRDIVVCTADPTQASAIGDIYLVGTTTTWTAVGVTGFDYTSVAFEPNWVGGRAVVAIGSSVTGTNFQVIQTTTPVQVIQDLVMAVTAVDMPFEMGAATRGILSSSLALPSDFDSTSPPAIQAYIGFSSAAGFDDVYRVDFNYTRKLGIAADVAIYSVSFSGSRAGGTLFAGETAGVVANAAAQVWYSADPQTALPTWSFSYKPPTGELGTTAANVVVAVAPDFASSSIVYAGTTGAESGFSRSTNGGISYNQLSLIDTTISGLDDVMPTPDGSAVFLSTNLATTNSSLWKSSTPPNIASWERVRLRTNVGYILRLSPDYLADSTLYWCDVGASGRDIQRSADGGDTFGNRTAPADIIDIAVESQDIVYMGDAANVRKSTNGTWFFGLPIAANVFAVNSLAMAPSYPDKPVAGNVLVGGTAGGVSLSTDGGSSFIPLLASAATGAMQVLGDKGYATNNLVYSASATANEGIYRYEVSVSTAWEQIRPVVAGMTGLAMHCGYLYGSWNDPGVTGTPVAGDAFTIITTAAANGSIQLATGSLDVTGSGATGSAITALTIIPGTSYTWILAAAGDWITFTVTPAAAATFGTYTIAVGAPVGTITSDADGDASVWIGGAVSTGAFSLPDASVTGAAAVVASAVERSPLPFVPSPVPFQTMDVGAATAVFNTAPSALRVSSNDIDVWLWAIDTTATAPALMAYNDAMAKTAPTVSVPSEVAADPASSRNAVFTISWNRISNATNYDIDITRDAKFTERATRNAGYSPPSGSSPEWLVPAGEAYLSAGKTYYVRVRSSDQGPGDAIWSKWSEGVEFTIAPGVPVQVTYLAPQPLGPVPGATGVPLSPGFTWAPYVDTTKYEFKLAKDAALTDILATDMVSTTAYLYADKLAYGTTFFWAVRAVEPAASGWSPVSSFTTEKAAPAPPAPPAPPTPAAPVVTPGIIWAIIAIGAILVIAVIVLILRTRRVA